MNKITNFLKFELDASKFDEEQDEIYEALGNSVGFDMIQQKTHDNSLAIDIKEEKYFYQLNFNNQIISFANENELENFVKNNVEYIEPYYILNIGKFNHMVSIKMRSLDLIIKYLIKFHKDYK